MDTFDALGAKYDYRFIKNSKEMGKLFGMKNFEVKRGDNGVVLNCKNKSKCLVNQVKSNLIKLE